MQSKSPIRETLPRRVQIDRRFEFFCKRGVGGLGAFRMILPDTKHIGNLQAQLRGCGWGGQRVGVGR
eukprot:618961-Amphidinium_carterae.1